MTRVEEQVRRFGFERDVADLVDHQQRVAAQPEEFRLQPSAAVGVGEPVDPLAGGGEQHRCPAWQPRMASPIAKWVLPVPGGAEEGVVVSVGWWWTLSA